MFGIMLLEQSLLTFFQIVKKSNAWSKMYCLMLDRKCNMKINIILHNKHILGHPDNKICFVQI